MIYHKEMPEWRKADRQNYSDGFPSDLPSRVPLVCSGNIVGPSPIGSKIDLEDKMHPVHWPMDKLSL